MSSRLHAGVGVVVAGLLGAACYTYEPLHAVEPQPGVFVEVDLTDLGAMNLESYLGADVAVVRGHFVSRDSNAVRIAVSSVETERGVVSSWRGEVVALPDAAVAGLHQRRLSRGRSLLLAGLGVTGLVATNVMFKLVGGGSGAGGSGGKPK